MIVTKDKMKTCFVLGTRPEIIKLYSVMNAAEEHKMVTPVFIHTGQHYDYEMSQVFLEELRLPEFHHFLNVKSGSHGTQTARLLIELEKTFMKEQPDVVIVLGDTNTTMAGALAGTKLGIPIAHVEAGCRSFDMTMPEEINRLIADAISSILFAPSEVSALNLLYGGHPWERIFLAGNTVVDIVEETRELRRSITLDLDSVGEHDVVVTLHRQENVDDKNRLKELITALGEIRGEVVFPIHPRTRKRIEEFGLISQVESATNLKLIKPLNFLSFMKLMEESEVVVTDSGGVQEEAVMLGVPCITARDTTEWPETVWTGGNRLAGRDAKNITTMCNEILSKPEKAKREGRNPFKGKAGKTIIKTLVKLWQSGDLRLSKPDMSDGKYPLPRLIGRKVALEKVYQTTMRFNRDGTAVVEDGKDVSNIVVRTSKRI
jgi:UDP-N-acetylglucosamine 2-epimerase (non-hydrolysing)